MIPYFLFTLLKDHIVVDNYIILNIKYKDNNLSAALMENYLLKTITFYDHNFSKFQFGKELSFKLKIPLIKSVLRNKHYQIDSINQIGNFKYKITFYRRKQKITVGKYIYLFLFDRKKDGYYIIILEINNIEMNIFNCEIRTLDYFKYQREKRKYNFFNYDIIKKINHTVKKVQQIREDKFCNRYYIIINNLIRKLFFDPNDKEIDKNCDSFDISSYNVKYI